MINSKQNQLIKSWSIYEYKSIFGYVPIESVVRDYFKNLEKIIKLMKKDKNITVLEIANRLKVTDKTIKRDILKLKNDNKLKRVGSLKSGY